MACWPLVPNHYLNQCCFISSKVQWHSWEKNHQKYPSHQTLKLALKWHTRNLVQPRRSQWIYCSGSHALYVLDQNLFIFMVADIEATVSMISSGTGSLAINWLALGRCDSNSRSVISNTCYGWSSWLFLRYCSEFNATEPFWWYVNIDSGNGLMPSGNKPLTEPMMTLIDGITTPQSVNSFTGPSATMISITINGNIYVFLESKFQQLTMFQWARIIYDTIQHNILSHIVLQ